MHFFVKHPPPLSRQSKSDLLLYARSLLWLARASPRWFFKETHGKGGFSAIRPFNPDLIVMEDITTARHGTQGIDRIREIPVWLYSAIFSGTWLGGDVQHVPMNRHLTQNGRMPRECRQEQRSAHQKLDS